MSDILEIIIVSVLIAGGVTSFRTVLTSKPNKKVRIGLIVLGCICFLTLAIFGGVYKKLDAKKGTLELYSWDKAVKTYTICGKPQAKLGDRISFTTEDGQEIFWKGDYFYSEINN